MNERQISSLTAHELAPTGYAEFQAYLGACDRPVLDWDDLDGGVQQAWTNAAGAIRGAVERSIVPGGVLTAKAPLSEAELGDLRERWLAAQADWTTLRPLDTTGPPQ